MPESQRQRPDGDLLMARAHVFDNMVEGVNVCDRDGIIFFTNRAFDEMFGYGRNELHGQHVSVLNAMGVEENAALVAEIIHSLCHGGKWEGELRNRRKEGKEFVTRARISTIRIGEDEYWVSLQEDVTRQRKLEEQLRHAQKIDALGRVATQFAHDFNNLLTAVLGNAAALQMNLPFGDRSQVYATGVLDAANRAANLSRRLLAFSRKEPSRPALVDAAATIEDMKLLLDHLIGPDASVSLGVTTKPAYVRMDPGELQQVILNLVLNARDAKPRDGQVQVSLRALEVDAAPRVLIEVGDKGVGMTSDHVSRIFEPFFTSKPPGEGTGLGLATTLDIVQRAFGEVGVQSEAGEGTIMTVSLPRAPAPKESTHAERAPSKFPRATGAYKVMVVDDNDAVLHFLARLLADAAYTVVVARNGKEALERFEQQPEVHLVISDIEMPHVNGVELAEKLWQSDSKLRVLFISGRQGASALPAHVRERAVGLVTKPFSVPQLGEQIAAALR